MRRCRLLQPVTPTWSRSPRQHLHLLSEELDLRPSCETLSYWSPTYICSPSMLDLHHALREPDLHLVPGEKPGPTPCPAGARASTCTCSARSWTSSCPVRTHLHPHLSCWIPFLHHVLLEPDSHLTPTRSLDLHPVLLEPVPTPVLQICYLRRTDGDTAAAPAPCGWSPIDHEL